jgi:truncated hemoglobin YjbI
VTQVESIYEHAGGAPAIRRFVEVFYASVLADPVLTAAVRRGHGR